MDLKKITNRIIIILYLCFAAGISAFIYNALNLYKISSDFTEIPLQFDPYSSSSVYQLQDVQVTVYGGFVKGIKNRTGGEKSLIIRALSPLPSIMVKSSKPASASLLIENINPDFYAKSIKGIKLPMIKVAVNTLQLNIILDEGETFKIESKLPSDADDPGKYKYIILGDNRDGYGTFGQIIDQVNGYDPVFVIDNGDLVFSGKPNQYRLFDQLVSGISTTFLTTLGNHDIRDNGRSTYTMLYGPAYYSFDFADSHFVFLDSSPGWANKRAISEEQYIWLEKDLSKSKGKHIYVINHIPPHDPRAGTQPNEIPNYVNRVKSGENWLEQRLNNYNENKDMDHGFQDPQEADRFEKLMSKYGVDTVYLSHIHSYMEYSRDGVRYLISGGAGAELLSKNSYYHYMVARIGVNNPYMMVELPSPANSYLLRYGATAKLFAAAMFKENPAAVILVLAGFVLLIILLLIRIYIWKRQPFDTLWVWLADVSVYSRKRFKELFGKQSKKLR